MFVAIAIKRAILQRFASTIFRKKTKGHRHTSYNMFNMSRTSAPVLVNVKIDNKIVTMEAKSGAAISVMSMGDFIKLNIMNTLYVKYTIQCVR